MIRKFKFEAEIYEPLKCLPMAAHRKLDAVGIKLGDSEKPSHNLEVALQEFFESD